MLSHTLLGMWLLINAEIEINIYLQRDTALQQVLAMVFGIWNFTPDMTDAYIAGTKV